MERTVSRWPFRHWIRNSWQHNVRTPCPAASYFVHSLSGYKAKLGAFHFHSKPLKVSDHNQKRLTEVKLAVTLTVSALLTVGYF